MIVLWLKLVVAHNKLYFVCNTLGKKAFLRVNNIVKCYNHRVYYFSNVYLYIYITVLIGFN